MKDTREAVTEPAEGYEAPTLTPVGSLEEFTLVRPAISQDLTSL